MAQPGVKKIHKRSDGVFSNAIRMNEKKILPIEELQSQKSGDLNSTHTKEMLQCSLFIPMPDNNVKHTLFAPNNT